VSHSRRLMSRRLMFSALPMLAFAMLTFLVASGVVAQEAKSPATAAPATAVPAKGAGKAADSTFVRLSAPSVRGLLRLTTEQQAKVTKLLSQRSTAIKSTPADKRNEVKADFEKKLSAVLTPEQLAAWTAKKLGSEREPRLKFNFRFQGWIDVLEWFADQADYSLVLDAPPPGTFNYDDNREYSPTEAIDLLNGVLLTKGYTLIRRDQMLFVINLADGLPQDMAPRVTLEEIDKRGKYEFVTVLFPLGKKNAEEVAAEFSPLLGKHGKAIALPKTGQVLVTDTAGIMRAVKAVIDSIPEPKPPEPKPKPEPPPKKEKPILVVYPLGALKPEAVLEIIEPLVAGAKLTVDPNAKQLNAFATPTQQAGIKLAVEQMLSGASKEELPEFQTYEIESADPVQVIKSLQPLVPNAKLTHDPEEGTIFAWGTPTEQQTIKTAIARLGGEEEQPGLRKIQVYRLTVADPAAVVTLLEPVVPKARMSYDPVSQSLVVVASALDQKLVAAAVEQIQQQHLGPQAPGIEIYSLKNRAPPELLTLLKTLVPKAEITLGKEGRQLIVLANLADQAIIKKNVDRIAQDLPAEETNELTIYSVTAAERKRFQAILGDIKNELPGIRVINDAEPGVLSIWARPTQHTMIAQTLEQLRREVPEEDKFHLVIYPVESADLNSVNSTIQSLYPGTRIVVDKPGSRLLIWTRPAEHLTIKTTIAQLDTGGTLDSDNQVVSYLLDNVDPATLTTMLKKLVPDVTLINDAKAGGIVAWASAQEHATISKTIKQLQASAQAKQRSRLVVYPVTATQRQRFDAVLPSLAAELPNVRVITDTQPGELAIWARPEQHQAIADLLPQLASEIPPERQFKLVSYPVNLKDLTSVAPLLTELFPQAKVVVEAKSKRLLIWATAEEHKKISETVEQLNAGESGQSTEQVKVYKVGKADLTVAIAMLQNLVPDATLSQDTAAKTIVAWATEQDHAVIARTVEELRTGTDASGQTISTYNAPPGSASGLARGLGILLPEAKIFGDDRSRLLVVTASKEDHAIVVRTLEQLQKTADDNRERLVAYSVGGVDPATAITMLKGLLPGVTLSLDPSSDRILARGRTSDHAILAEAIKQLGNKDGAATNVRQLVIYPLGGADPTAATAMLKQLAPQATIVSDPVAETLMVRTKTAEHVLIAKALERMQLGAARKPQDELVTYPIKQIDATAVMTMLSQLAPAANLVHDPKGHTIVARARAADQAIIADAIERMKTGSQEQERPHLVVYPVSAPQRARFQGVYDTVSDELTGMRIIADSRPGELSIWATDEQHTIVGDMLKELEQEVTNAEKYQLVVYPINTGDPTTTHGLLQQMYPETSITLDADGNRVIVWTGAAIHARIVETLGQLESGKAGSNQRELKAYSLKKANPTTLARMLANVAPKAIITPDTTAKMITVWAREADHKLIADAVERMEKHAGEADDTVLAIYRGLGGQASGLERMLRSVVPTAQVDSDYRSGNLIAWASPEDQKIIKNAVDQLKSEGDDGTKPQLQAYDIESADPDNVYDVLRTMFRREYDITLSLDDENNRLMAIAPPQKQEQIRKLIEQMDKVDPTKTDVTLQAYPLKNSNPATLAAMLQKLAPKATITPDLTADMIVVWANQADHKVLSAAIDNMEAQARAANDAKLIVYRGLGSKAPTLERMLASVAPDADVDADYRSGNLAVWASEDDQKIIAEAVKQFRDDTSDESKPLLKAYDLQTADSDNVLDVLRTMFRREFDVTLSIDEKNDKLIVIAPAERQDQVRNLIEQMDKVDPAKSDVTLQGYPLRSSNATTLAAVLTNLAPKATITPDSTADMIVVWANQSDHKVLSAAINNMEAQAKAANDFKLIVYRGLGSKATTLERMLASVVPDADVDADYRSGNLAVWASENDQETIAEAIKQFRDDTSDESKPLLQAYTLKTADPDTVLDALQTMFRREFNVSLTVDEENDKLVVIAPPQRQEQIRSLVEQMDQLDSTKIGITLQAHSLNGIDVNTVVESLENLLKDERPELTLSVEKRSRQLVALATAEQHKRLEATLEVLKIKEPILEVLQLRTVDPFTAQLAIERLFAEATTGETEPALESDLDTSQLYIRASEAQIAKIRELLIKMGETLLELPNGGNHQSLRTIPFGGNPALAIEQIQRIWPQLRPNKIRVLGVPESTPDSVPSHQPVLPQDNSLVPQPPAPSAEFIQDAKLPVTTGDQQESDVPPIRAKPVKSKPVESVTAGTEVTATNTNIAPATDDTAAAPDAGSEADEQASTDSGADILISVGNGVINIASDDAEALDQMETLFRSMNGDVGLGTTDFAVYLLTNTSADAIATMLGRLFPRSVGFGMRGAVMIEPDLRLNALVVHASRNDRATIEKLLDILDSPHMTDTFATNKPSLIQVLNTQAEQIEQVLRVVYKVHLSTGGGRKSIPVPEGVGSEIASMLAQVNAANSAPMMTLTVDRTTNSLVLMAPKNLREEVTELAERLDTAAKGDSARSVKFIQLKHASATRVQKSLDRVLQDAVRRSRRSR